MELHKMTDEYAERYAGKGTEVYRVRSVDDLDELDVMHAPGIPGLMIPNESGALLCSINTEPIYRPTRLERVLAWLRIYNRASYVWIVTCKYKPIEEQ